LNVISSSFTGADPDPAKYSADVMGYSHQTSTDRVKSVAAQQVEGQGALQCKHLNAIALVVAVGVLTELGIPRPVPLVFNCPARPHQTQQRFWADAQVGDNFSRM